MTTGVETEIRGAAEADAARVRALLEAAGLPTVELDRWLNRFVVAESRGELVGAAGLEVHGASGVLRSVVVEPGHRGRGLGERLTESVLERARAAGLGTVYLLTETAEGFFPRLGFRRIERDAVPAEVAASVEFAEACPASAVCMMRSL